jgi:hypothetical protein
MNVAVFDYKQVSDISWMPLIPIHLEFAGRTLQTEALVDSGFGVNLLPYAVGLNLGLRWEDQTQGPNLTGNASSDETRLISLECIIPNFEPMYFGFVWSKGNQRRILLGQQNFFSRFDVCFIGRSLKLTLMLPVTNGEK